MACHREMYWRDESSGFFQSLICFGQKLCLWKCSIIKIYQLSIPDDRIQQLFFTSFTLRVVQNPINKLLCWPNGLYSICTASVFYKHPLSTGPLLMWTVVAAKQVQSQWNCIVESLSSWVCLLVKDLIFQTPVCGFQRVRQCFSIHIHFHPLPLSLLSHFFATSSTHTCPFLSHSLAPPFLSSHSALLPLWYQCTGLLKACVSMLWRWVIS